MTVNHAKNLATEPPRSPRLRLHEYVIICRTIDKCRAAIAGTLGEFHFDCPLDRMLFTFKGTNGDDFKAQVQAAATDEDVALWFDQAGDTKTEAEVREWSTQTESYKPYEDSEKRDWFVGECERVGLDPKTSTLFDYLEADDAEMKK